MSRWALTVFVALALAGCAGGHAYVAGDLGAAGPSARDGR